MDKVSKEICFNTDRILQGIDHFSKTTAIIDGLNHSLKSYDPEKVLPLEINGLPLKFQNTHGKVVATEEVMFQWILKKGIEELVAGLTQSLMEVHRFINLRAIARDSEQEIYTVEQIEQEIEDINTTPLGLHFPTLIKDIEKELNAILPYKEEVISINQLRNCLVHRNGIVSEKDVNDSLNSSLIFRYRELRIHVQIAGSYKTLTKEMKNQGLFVENIHPEPDVKKELITAIGEPILLDADIYHGILYTFVNFIHELIHKLPIPEDMKDRLIPPYVIGN